ncbi:glycosyltransferase family 4 protein [Tamlana sp. 2_MG-2023]|uniref:glycosyltransferase family 4 protein n=1 Tax=unclassified Tamlana TaxID=2614803 RepID=UPI0026E28BBD|nr:MULTISPECIES: glycosyltransferase family 4 protein [unclassified Tamlana]MDO6758763.1 glycosyltransferase family 4 protein [Tamlana sp. 2_MG-2023]MDO6789462.1 glycosyltransferase family 4 protein [Tamlana sp. 1_MG-2023]
MNIAFLTPEYPHPKTGSAGGIGTSIVSLAKALVEQGHRVSILVYGQDQDDYFEDAGIHFFKIKNIKVKGLSLFLTQKKVERLINNLYAEKKIDLVEAPDWTGFTSFVQPKCPLVIRQNGSDTYFCHHDKRKVKLKNKFLERRALKKADGLISVSEYTGNLTNKLFGLNRDFTVIPNGIDIKRFTPSASSLKKETILYFGTLIRKKGLLELPEIFNQVHKKNKEVELLLVGKDSGDIQTGYHSTWALMQPLFNSSAMQKVRYLGAVPYSEMQNLIQEATVCVFPTFAEALPVSWLEAMAMEKAIVASNIGWANEMIEDALEGFLVHPTEYQDYAKRILELLEDDNLRVNFGQSARKKVVQVFSHELVARQSVEFYKKILNS